MMGESAMSRGDKDFILKYLPQQGLVVEIGTFFGVTCCELAEARPNCHFLSVDPFCPGRDKGVSGDVNCWYQNHKSNMNLFVGTSKDLDALRIGLQASAVIVDGDHSEEGCREDLVIARGWLPNGGPMFVHDFRRHCFPEVDLAVDKFIAEGLGKLIEVGAVVGLVEVIK